jgi:hypothetical protein
MARLTDFHRQQQREQGATQSVLRARDDGNEGEVSYGAARPAGRPACAALAWQSWRVARGPWPARPPAWARRTGGKRAEVPRRAVHRNRLEDPYARALRARHVADGTGATLWSARRRRSAQFLFHLPVFEIA